MLCIDQTVADHRQCQLIRTLEHQQEELLHRALGGNRHLFQLLFRGFRSCYKILIGETELRPVVIMPRRQIRHILGEGVL